jgi:hypothetical protein
MRCVISEVEFAACAIAAAVCLAAGAAAGGAEFTVEFIAVATWFNMQSRVANNSTCKASCPANKAPHPELPK